MFKSTRKIVFLDIDGVLNYSKNIQRELKAGRTIKVDSIRLSENALRLLKSLQDKTNAIIVIHSNWRKHKSKLDNALKQLNESGIYVYDTTEILENSIKEEEILHWINNQSFNINIEDYIILDDIEDEFSIKTRNHLVLCSWDDGFSEEQYYKALNKLTNHYWIESRDRVSEADNRRLIAI